MENAQGKESDIENALVSIRSQLERLNIERCGKWDESHDNLLKLWRKQASINLWLQLASNYYYAKLNDYLSYPAIIVSAATSIGVFGSDNSLAGKFAISILALIAGTLTAINKHCRAPEKSQEFALRAKDYYTFIREIDFIMSTKREERPVMSETLERVKATYDRIVDMQMEPPIHVIRDYEKKFRPLSNSLFSDLKSELRSPSSSTSSISSEKELETAKTCRATSLHIPTMNKNANFDGQIDITVLRDAKTSPLSRIITPVKDQIGKKQIKAIFSPYQLFSTNPMKLDEEIGLAKFASPLGTQYSLGASLPSLDGRSVGYSSDGKGILKQPTLSRVKSDAAHLEKTKMQSKMPAVNLEISDEKRRST